MAMRERQVTYYQVECDRCGALGPRTLIEREARVAAQHEGWVRRTRCTALRCVEEDLCPGCFEELKAEKEQATYVGKT